jgi:hypothetical protein
MAGSSNMLHEGFRSFFVTKDIISANWQASVAIERITRDLRSMRSSSDIHIAGANSLEITNSGGQRVVYQVANNQLRRGSEFIANNVESIAFSYHNKDGETLVPSFNTLQRSDIRYIVITLTMNYDRLNHKVTVTTMAYLWNIKK